MMFSATSLHVVFSAPFSAQKMESLMTSTIWAYTFKCGISLSDMSPLLICLSVGLFVPHFCPLCIYLSYCLFLCL